ncbi:MAG: DUF3237 domain-containing protein [Polyangiaceae bacterium]
MKLAHEGLSLWYGTPDAPAPLGEVVPRDQASLVVGASPPNPTNAVEVRYRVDGGFVRAVRGREIRSPAGRRAQYFAVEFPTFWTGQVVEYCPVLTCGGRQVPAPPADKRFPAKFRLPGPGAPVAAAERVANGGESPAGVQRFAPNLTFLAAMRVKFTAPQIIGETPEGVHLNYYGKEGAFAGPKVSGRLLSGAADHLYIRPDGVGVIRVRATLETDDGAVIDTEYTGSLELGRDGYEKAVLGRLPRLLPLAICPRFLTGHAAYQWMNRLQCLAVGVVNLSISEMNYDLFSVGFPPATATPR